MSRPGFRGNGRGFRGRGGGRGRGRGRGFHSGRKDGFEKPSFNNDSEWHQSVRENRQALEIEFADYTGEKKHELPESFVKLLNEERTEAKDDSYFEEPDYGISEYMSSEINGFSGIMKHRFSDFIVHEIDKDGNEVKLTDLALPPKATITAPDTFAEYNDLEEEEKNLFSVLTWTRLIQLATKVKESLAQKGASENAEVRIDVTSKTKEERKCFHQLIRKRFPHLDTSTVGDEKKFVVVTAKKAKVRDDDWPRDRPKHLGFHLCKENMDSSSIFGQIARELGIHNSKFRVAGTKDRRSISTQKVCAAFVKAESVRRAVSNIRGRVSVGNFTYQRESLELGDLKGNNFTIVIRHVDAPEEAVKKAMKHLENNGFVNYFGQQRFGTDSNIKTSDIGLALVKKQWQNAVELILKPRGNESPQMTRMRAHWWIYRKPADAVILLGSRISQSKSIEATLLNGLARLDDNDFVGGLSSLQKNTQLLYVHAYQALIWNKAVSKRIEKFGLKVLIGDCVLLPAEDIKGDQNGSNEKDEKENDENKNGSEDFVTKLKSKESRMVEVTVENIDKYSIYDVVMPIPGHKVSVPPNEDLKTIYLDFLKADGLDKGFDSFKNSVDMYSLPGDYRYIFLKPNHVDWRLTRYDDPNLDLLVSDFQLLKGKNHAEEVPNGQHLAVIVDLALPSSSYATMALREAMKMDMGKHSQSKLTMAMNDKLALKRKEENGDEVNDGEPETKIAKS